MKVLCATGLVLLISSTHAMAQRDGRTMESGVVTIVNSHPGDSAKNVEQAFKTNSPTSPKENNLPRFAVVGRDRMFYLGIGVQFLGEGMFDWGDEMPSNLDFSPSTMTPSTAGNGGRIGFAWQSSSIHFNFVAMPNTGNQVGIYFKAKFNSAGGMKCSHIFARYRGLTVGYTNSLFKDGAAQPFTIDSEGPNGYPSISLFTAYWEQPFGRGFSGAIGLDAPTADCTVDPLTDQVSQRIPAFPLYLQYAYNGNADHIRLSGLLRPMQYRDVAFNHNSTLLGLGVQLSGITTVAGPVSFTYNVAYGRGIASYIQDDDGLNMDATPTVDAGCLSLTRSLGMTAGLAFDFSSCVSANLVYSHLTNWLGDNARSLPDQYRYGTYVAANVVYNFNRFLSAGLEYDYGNRHTFDGSTLHCNRIQAQIAMTF